VGEIMSQLTPEEMTLALQIEKTLMRCVDTLEKSSKSKATIQANIKETNEKNQAARVQNEIINDTEKQKTFFTSGPLYLKPAGFLDSFSPFLRITLITDLANHTNPINRIELFSTLSQSATSEYSGADTYNAQHNMLQKFTYEVKKEGSAQIVFELVDVDQEQLNMIAFYLSTMQQGNVSSEVATSTLYFEVTYGWAPPKGCQTDLSNLQHFKSVEWYNKNGKRRQQNVYYTKTLYMVAGGASSDGQGCAIKYNEDGTGILTVSGGFDNTFPSPLKSLNPFNVMGPLPASNLAMHWLDRILRYYLVHEITRNDRMGDLIKLCYSLHKTLITIGCDDNITETMELLVSAVRYYYSIKDDKIFNAINQQSINQLCNRFKISTNDKNKKSKLFIKLKDIYFNGDRLKKIDEKNTNLKSVEIYRSLTINDLNNANVSGYNLKPSSNYEEIAKFQSYIVDYAGQYKELNKTFTLTQMLEVNINTNDELALERYEVGVNIDYFQKLSKMASTVNIHSWYMYNYVLHALDYNLLLYTQNNNKFRKFVDLKHPINLKDFQEQLVILDQSLINDNEKDLSEAQDDLDYHNKKVNNRWNTDGFLTKKYKGNVLPKYKSEFLASDFNPYCVKPIDLTIEEFTSWGELLGKTANNIYISYKISSLEEAKQYGVEEEYKKGK